MKRKPKSKSKARRQPKAQAAGGGHLCACGCGQQPKGQRSKFVMGHDARVKPGSKWRHEHPELFQS
jgi:hypothetical protein